MGDLEQQLRGLSKENFESFVHQFLVARYPGAEIKRVDGTGGDAGIDSFRGKLDSGPAIWQSKHFSDRIRKSQQKQILKSIKAALKSLPSLWTLCVPINLRTPEHKWFQEKVVAVYGGTGRIKLVQAADFLTELQHNRALRDAFFPDDSLSAMMNIRKVVTLTEARSQEQMGLLATEYAQQYLASSMEIEPRLEAVVSLGGRPELRQPSPMPGLVMSIAEGSKSTHFFARDVKAFNLDPIKVNMEMPQVHREALETAIDTGRKFTLPIGKLLSLQSSSPLLNSFFSKSDLTKMQFEMIPKIPEELAAKVMPLRLIAGSGSSAKVLQYVPFRVTRTGRREIALVSQGPLPLEVSIELKLQEDGCANISMRPILPGSDIRMLDQVLQFLDELERSTELQVDSIEIDVPILKEVGSSIRSHLDVAQELREVISDAAVVAAVFRKPLRLPEKIGRDDAEDLKTLRRIATGEKFTGVNWNAALTKSEQHRENALNGFAQNSFSIKVDHPSGWRNFEIFGELIEPGPLTFIGEGTDFLDIEEIRAAYVAAGEGESIPVQAYCSGSCRFIRQTWNRYSAVLCNASAVTELD